MGTFDNPNAVFNPSRAAQEFAGGAIVGGILGGAEIGIGKAATAVSQRKIGNHIIQNNQVRDAIRMGFESDVDSPAYRAAVELSEQLVNGEKLSPHVSARWWRCTAAGSFQTGCIPAPSGPGGC